MANNTEIESNCEYDQRDNDGDKGGGDEGGGLLHPLDAMAKLQKYASCELPYNRQLVGRILVEIFRGAVDDGIELNVAEVMQPIYKLVNDTDINVRQELVEQLPHVAMICQEAPERFGNVLSNHLIRIIANFHHDNDQQVRQSTHIALLKLIERGLLDKDSAEFIIAPTLLLMPLLPSELEFHRAIDGMSKVASVLEPKTAERLFLDRYLMLCKDSIFTKKSCAMHFGEFAAAMTKETLYELLLPMYETLCKDPVWSVRKSCVDSMVSVACCVSLEYRRTTLSQILANHLDDESKWVRLSAFQILGPFITTFAEHFTGFAYKQYGELVLTDQHGTELRYNIISFLGMGEMSASCTAASDEDFGIDNEQLNSLMRNEVAVRNVDITSGNKKKYVTTDTNKENVSTEDGCNVTKTFKQRLSQKRIKALNKDKNWLINKKSDESFDTYDKSSESHDLYNPFLYYYIPPDLPLDQEFIDAVTSENSTTKQQIEENDVSTEIIDNSNNVNIQLLLNEVMNKESSSLSSSSSNDVVINDKTEEIQKCEVTTEIIVDNETKNENDEFIIDGELCKREDVLKSCDVTLNVSTVSSDNADPITKIENTSTSSSSTTTTTTTTTTSSSSLTEVKQGQHIVPQELIDFFVSMAEPEIYYDLKWNSAEIPRFCAFCFPAVVLTLGKENWHMLKTAYEYLSDAREYRVRRTMASSIHEVAMILGEELSAQDLLPIYDGFIKDLDEVRIGALKHLATFLNVLKPKDRSQFLPRLQAFLSMDNEWNWRFREEVASQFLQAIPLYSTTDVSTHIAPLSFPLLQDKVAAVRQMALELVTEIVSYLSSDETLVVAIIQELKSMLTPSTSKWTCRQTFALLCASLLKHNAISAERFATELLPSLLKLASDRVPNVRLAVIRTIKTQVRRISNSFTDEQICKMNEKIELLGIDRDRDVRIIAGSFTRVRCLYREFKKLLEEGNR